MEDNILTINTQKKELLNIYYTEFPKLISIKQAQKDIDEKLKFLDDQATNNLAMNMTDEEIQQMVRSRFKM